MTSYSLSQVIENHPQLIRTFKAFKNSIKNIDLFNLTACLSVVIFSNYWMRLSRIWRILQIKEGVIHRGWGLRSITPFEICRILHILRKLNSIIDLLFIQNISLFLKEFHHFALCFSAHWNNTTLACPQVLMSFWRHRFNNFQWAALLSHWFNTWSTAAGCGELCMRF